MTDDARMETPLGASRGTDATLQERGGDADPLFTVGGRFEADLRRTSAGRRFSRVVVRPIWTKGQPPLGIGTRWFFDRPAGPPHDGWPQDAASEAARTAGVPPSPPVRPAPSLRVNQAAR